MTTSLKSLCETYRAGEQEIKKAFSPECAVIIDGSGAGRSAIADAMQFKAVRDEAGVEAAVAHGVTFLNGGSPILVNVAWLRYVAGLPDFGNRHLLYFVWLAVLARNLSVHTGVDSGDFAGAWEEAAGFLANHPETTARFLSACDKALDGRTFVLVCDLLPLAEEDAEFQYKVVQSLLRVALRARSSKNFRVKVVLTPQMVKSRYPFDFPDASKLRADEVALMAGDLR